VKNKYRDMISLPEKTHGERECGHVASLNSICLGFLLVSYH